MTERFEFSCLRRGAGLGVVCGRGRVGLPSVVERFIVFFGLIGLIGLCCGMSPLMGGGVEEELFVRRVGPLFSERCLPCHGEDEAKRKGGFDMRTAESIQRGGESGQPALVVGSPEESPIYLSVTRKHQDWEAMPPKQADKLSEQQVSWIREWIGGGASWPSEERRREIARERGTAWAAEDGLVIQTNRGSSAEWNQRKYKPEGLWGYAPVRKPATERAGSHAIDELIERRVPAGLKVASPASAHVFLRRLTFDLTGLPPTPEELESFGSEYAENANRAVQRAVDRLLESPHYGERMAQHWLDVVRYADSGGFANDYERGNAWRYRDYVVRSFNSDKPYNEFVREQIAGDEIDESNPEMLVATGFLRMGPWELTAMEVPKIARQRFLDDVTNSVGETFLAHALQCARCHDHKFDPVPTADYYSMQAVFATTQLAERPAAFLPSENTQGFEERRYAEKRRAEFEATLERLDGVLLRNAQQWFQDQGKDPKEWDAALSSLQAESAAMKKGSAIRRSWTVFERVRKIFADRQVSETAYPPKLVGFTPQEYGMERVARKGLERLKWELDRYEPVALSVYNGRTPEVKQVSAPVRIPSNRMSEGELEQTRVLAGGDPFASGALVQPGVLSVVSNAQRREIPVAMEGRRLAFAEWVASKENPLTTRSIVNRVWMWHFGDPLAGNPNNFGTTGKLPTHPELLDWLAASFVDQGWSFKALHRLILNSAAYRRSEQAPDLSALREKDPGGIFLTTFRPRRLSAEELRDAMLFASGELNPSLGGIPNRPEIHLEAALQPRQVMGTFASAWVPNSLPSERHRRSLYALKLRGLSDPLMEVFNVPPADFSCEKRESSTVTPQVFSMFNGRVSLNRALALARRVLSESPEGTSAIRNIYLRVFGRPPGEDEMRGTLAHWRRMEEHQKKLVLAQQRPPLRVEREAVEENTGERFVFEELLDANADFVPDVEISDLDVRTRALGDLCLVLLNSNEFAYVY